jgi:probable F420-dependent oxidoreductase
MNTNINPSGRQPRVGIYLPAYHLPDETPPTAQFLAAYAQHAEELGFESLWVIDHLFVAPPSYRVAYLEPLTVLTIAAVATQHVRLGTGILVLPLRDPVVTAKSLATLDAISGGRLIFGAGVGWDPHEFAACQIDRATRGQRMDEMLEVIVGLWTQESFSYAGKHFTLDDVRLMPRPIQQPRPPIWLAGGSVPPGTSQHITQQKGYAPERSLRRVSRFGDALMSAYRSVPNGDASWLVHDRTVLDQLLAHEGRDPSSMRHTIQDHMYINLDGSETEIRAKVRRFTYKPFEEIAPYYLLGTPEAIIPKLQARIDAGIDEIAINFIDPDPEQLDLFAQHIRPHLAAT